MTAALLLGSVALLLAGHLFRLLRWEQFIRIYERPMRGVMLRGMAVGYGVNFLLPFHIGDVFRAWFTGRRMKNGVGFALATVIMDRFLDVWVVALLFGAFRLAGVPGVRDDALYYLVFAVVLAAALAVVIALRGPIKRLCLAVCGIFNDAIKLDGLEFCWSLINTFKDLRRVQIGRLALNTGLMWVSYLASYGVLAAALSGCGAGFGGVDVFTRLCGTDAVDLTSFSLTGRLPLCEILRGAAEPGCCWYDMAYAPTAVSMFRYLHSNPVEKSAAILRDVLTTLDATLYTPARPASPAAIEAYLDGKVDANLARIREARGLRELAAYDRVWVNGRSCKGLPALGRLFDHARLRALFAGDPVATIHGDLTLENIICRTGEDSWYLIDPNTGNLHESPFLDYGKLLQSLHGGYEFMMMTPRVSVHENRIDFTFTRSAAYDALFAAVRDYLNDRFTPAQVESIFLHELIHWLRLMPYKINRDRKRAPMFFAGLLMVANDIDAWYPEGPG